MRLGPNGATAGLRTELDRDVRLTLRYVLKGLTRRNLAIVWRNSVEPCRVCGALRVSERCGRRHRASSFNGGTDGTT